jgi:hypothetical protein
VFFGISAMERTGTGVTDTRELAESGRGDLRLSAGEEKGVPLRYRIASCCGLIN